MTALQLKWNSLMASGRAIIDNTGSLSAANRYAAGRRWSEEARAFLQNDGEELDQQYPGQNLVDSLGTVYDRVVAVVNETQGAALPSPAGAFFKSLSADGPGVLSKGMLLAAAGLVVLVLLARR